MILLRSERAWDGCETRASDRVKKAVISSYISLKEMVIFRKCGVKQMTFGKKQRILGIFSLKPVSVIMIIDS